MSFLSEFRLFGDHAKADRYARERIDDNPHRFAFAGKENVSDNDNLALAYLELRAMVAKALDHQHGLNLNRDAPMLRPYQRSIIDWLQAMVPR